MSEKRATTQISVRVHTDTLEHYKAVATEKNVPWNQEIRNTLSRGFECEIGRCPHKVRADERGRRNAELMARVEELEAASPLPDDDPLAAPELPSFEASFVLEEHNAWVPIPAWRLLDDRGLVAKGCCLEHRQMREECDAAQLHDEGR